MSASWDFVPIKKQIFCPYLREQLYNTRVVDRFDFTGSFDISFYFDDYTDRIFSYNKGTVLWILFFVRVLFSGPLKSVSPIWKLQNNVWWVVKMQPLVGAYDFWPGMNLFCVMPAVKRSLWFFFFFFFWLFLSYPEGSIISVTLYDQHRVPRFYSYIICRSLQEISNVFYCTVRFYPDMNEIWPLWTL